MKQFHVHINEKEEFIINSKENEAFSICITNNPYYKEREMPTTVMRIEGNRWSGEQMDNLEWEEKILTKGNKISIEIKDSYNKASKLFKDERYVKPEDECTFCHKKKSEVKHLIAAEFFALICDACISECVRLINEKEKT